MNRDLISERMTYVTWREKGLCAVGVLRIERISSLFVMGTEPPCMWQQCDATHSQLYSAVVKNVWSFTYTSQYVFIAWRLEKGKILACLSMKL
jgi:hypothetical protein